MSLSLKKIGIEFKRIRILFSRLNIYTKIFVILFICSTIILSIMWFLSGKTYLYVGSYHIGNLSIGPYEGKIFYSTILTLGITFLISFYLLVEKQRRHPLIAFIIAYLAICSASSTFEYVYILLYWQTQLMLQYFPLVSWWFGLLSGYVVGFLFKFMKLNKLSIILFSLFLLTMALWYLAGYPQLVHKETLAFTSQNYINLPVEMALPFNILSKFLVFMAVASLLNKNPKKLQTY